MPSRQGSPNKPRQALLARLKEMYGDEFDPIMKMAENCMRMEQIAEEIAKESNEGEFSARKECANSWSKMAEYITPKLRSVDAEINVNDSQEAWLKKIEEMDVGQTVQ